MKVCPTGSSSCSLLSDPFLSLHISFIHFCPHRQASAVSQLLSLLFSFQESRLILESLSSENKLLRGGVHLVSWSVVPNLSLGPDCTIVSASIKMMWGRRADRSTRSTVKLWLGLRITDSLFKQQTFTSSQQVFHGAGNTKLNRIHMVPGLQDA